MSYTMTHHRGIQSKVSLILRMGGMCVTVHNLRQPCKIYIQAALFPDAFWYAPLGQDPNAQITGRTLW